MTSCDAIRQRRAEDSVAAAELHADIRHHLEGCAACTKFLAQLQAVFHIASGFCEPVAKVLVAFGLNPGVVIRPGLEATLKRLYRRGSRVQLVPANPDMKPIELPARDVEIRGVVRGLLRRY